MHEAGCYLLCIIHFRNLYQACYLSCCGRAPCSLACKASGSQCCVNTPTVPPDACSKAEWTSSSSQQQGLLPMAAILNTGIGSDKHSQLSKIKNNLQFSFPHLFGTKQKWSLEPLLAFNHAENFCTLPWLKASRASISALLSLTLQ